MTALQPNRHPRHFNSRNLAQSRPLVACLSKPQQPFFLLPLLGAIIFMLAGCQFPGFGGKTTEEASAPLKNPCIVLALPASGAFSGTAAKIKRGASLAQKEMQARGTDLRIENINTEAPDWLTRLEALPAACAVVGGPIQEKKYQEARKAGSLGKRIFFTFTPALQKGDEGQLAWRFFPSPQDQIDALTHFVTDDLNIHTYGAFYPTDNYGRRMVELLENSLSKRHMPLQKAAYNPANPAEWSDAIKPLVKPVTPEGGKNPVPQTMFEALFVPDSWKHLDLVVTSLLYNGEDRLVMLGPMLWEQALAGKKVTRPDKYELAIFPGAWNSARAPKSLQGAGNDFWVALGYDFANFAAATRIGQLLPAADVNARAQGASASIRAMAPMSWGNNGVARQHLYIFQITGNGMRAVTPEQFREKRSAALERAALRMQNIEEQPAQPVEETASTGEEIPAQQAQPAVMPQTQAPAAQTQPQAAPAQPPLSTVPQPSYKLRLPGKR